MSAESCRWPSDFPQAAELWSLIGSGSYESRGAKLTHIRNPVVRVVAKIIGNILFAKDESGAIRRDELMLLHFGLPSFVRDIYTSPPPSTLRTNLGAIFAENLVSKKARGLNTVNKKVERIGSLLTPLFMHHDISFSTTSCEPKVALFDEQYFRNSGILKPGFIYQFQDRTGAQQYCKLPLREFTAPTSRANLDFALPPEHLMTHPSAPRRRGSSSRASTSQPHLEDYTVPDAGPTAEDMEFIMPPWSGEFDLPPLPAAATEAERWTFESHRIQHSILERMWRRLSTIRCPRPPSCFRAPEQSRADHRTVDTREAEDTEDPDVAGHRTSDTEDAGDRSDTDARLARRRRQAGQSQSASSDER